jgi:hypothetical protein
MNNRILGSLALAGAPFFMLSSFLQPYFSFMHEQQFYGAWGVIYLGAWMCSIRGLQRLKATGKSMFGKAILWIMLGALLLAALSNVYKIIEPGTRSPLFFMLDAFWPLSNLAMFVVGITVAVARQLKGWRRFIPLFAWVMVPGSGGVHEPVRPCWYYRNNSRYLFGSCLELACLYGADH